MRGYYGLYKAETAFKDFLKNKMWCMSYAAYNILE